RITGEDRRHRPAVDAALDDEIVRREGEIIPRPAGPRLRLRFRRLRPRAPQLFLNVLHLPREMRRAPVGLLTHRDVDRLDAEVELEFADLVADVGERLLVATRREEIAAI